MTRGMKGTRAPCGTVGGYRYHVRYNEPIDEACRQASWRYEKFRRYGVLPVGYIDGTGTARRLQALACLGWSAGAIATHMGVSEQQIIRLRANPPRVLRRTAKAVARVYDQLSMVPRMGDSSATRARQWAYRHGWAPPLAWDEAAIDDPASRPSGKRPRRRYQPLRARLRIEDILWLTEVGGLSPELIAERLMVTTKAVERALERHQADTS